MRHVLMAMSVATTLVVPTVAAAETVAIACGTVGKEFELCKQGAEAWAKKAGHEVKLVSGSTDASEQLTVFQQQLSAGSPDIDVFRVDVVWPSTLGSHFIDLKQYIPEETVKQHFPAIVQNNTVGGKLVAMPWFTDAGVLYYRKDLLEKHKQKPPTTWAELATSAKLVQDAERKAGNDKMVGFVFQAKAAETLTCNALEWVDSFGGGSIIGTDGKATIDNPKAVEAIKTAASWIGTISPQGVLNYDEEGARGVFQSGNAVYMRNWPYAWSLANSPDSPINGKVGVVEPGGVQVLQAPGDRGGPGEVPHEQRGAEAPRHRGLLQPHHPRALQGRGRAQGEPLLRHAPGHLHQRGGAPRHGDGHQVQPGERGLPQRRARGALRRQARGQAQGPAEEARQDEQERQVVVALLAA